MKFIDEHGNLTEDDYSESESVRAADSAVITIPVKLTQEQVDYIKSSMEAASQWVREAVQQRMDKEQR